MPGSVLPSELATTGELARRYGVCAATILRRTRRGLLHPIGDFRPLRFSIAEADRVMLSRRG